MLRSTTHGKTKQPGIRLWAVAFWLLLWHGASLALQQDLLLVSPVSVILRLAALATDIHFWQSILFSLSRIGLGMLLAVIAGILLAALAARYEGIHALLAPLMVAMKATPVASFIILVLLWLPSRHLAVLVSFFMAMPILYENTFTGILHTDEKLLEMVAVFHVPFSRQLRYLYIPQIFPFFQAGFVVSFGLCWKSGIAAEVIGLPKGSIGERLYQAKIFLDTPDLFAWTLVIIFASLLCEKTCLFLLKRALSRLEGR